MRMESTVRCSGSKIGGDIIEVSGERKFKLTHIGSTSANKTMVEVKNVRYSLTELKILHEEVGKVVSRMQSLENEK